ncbi:MAG: C69 family dipeptidase [Anaerolineaceae bacterium]
MCDTSVVLASAAKNGEAFFAKNSDRDPNEAQYLVMLPAQVYAKDEQLRCTYIEIPQVRHTNKILLSKPYWMWGAEMGANECGVVIGNEAVFTKVPAKKEPGLIGMDYLRLALERSSSAIEALNTITSLLQQYGQSGNCSKEHGLYYNNSYLIMDDKEAYVLETVDRMWIAKKVIDFYAISNALSITTEWDLISADLVDYAIDRKWCRDRGHFNFAESYSDLIYTRFSQGCERRNHVMGLLQGKKGQIDLQFMKSVLRSHSLNSKQTFTDRSLTAWNVCMHAGPGPIRNSQTTGSFITQFSKDAITHWVTGTAAPCLSVFKPVWMPSGLPDIGSEPTQYFTENSLWWLHEILHRRVLKDFTVRKAVLEVQIEKLEKQIEQLIAFEKKVNTKTCGQISRKSFQMEKEQFPFWNTMVENEKSDHKNAVYFEKYWQKNNQKVHIPV